MGLLDINHKAGSQYIILQVQLTNINKISLHISNSPHTDALSQQKVSRPLAAFEMQNQKGIKYQQEVLQHKCSKENNRMKAVKSGARQMKTADHTYCTTVEVFISGTSVTLVKLLIGWVQLLDPLYVVIDLGKMSICAK